MKISFRIETRFRFMYQQSYFSGNFSTYTLKNVNKTSYFANNLYFGHNERRFRSEFHSKVKFRSKFVHDSESTFHSGLKSGMKNGMNSIRNKLQLNPDSCKKYHSIQYDLNRNGMSSIRIETQSGFM